MKHKTILDCRIVSYNFDAKGRIDGLLIDIGGRTAQIRCRDERAVALVRENGLGAALRVAVSAHVEHTKHEAAHPVYRLRERRSTRGGAVLSATRKALVTGLVQRINYARHGQANGVVLEGGDYVHMKPRGMRRVPLVVGDRVEADGKVRITQRGGRVVEATAVNAVRLKGPRLETAEARP